MSKEAMKAGWKFDNSYARLPESMFAQVNPVPVSSPKIVVFNELLAQKLGLDPTLLNSDEGAIFLSGNEIPEGAEPLAQAYAGHQFGHFTRLGDGRAVLLGEQLIPSGERVDIQLKGSGRTPYSRGGDGRAALGPMLREYIISEAMHGLGIPTTRSLAVVATGESVIRETRLSGAILTRIASSHIRVGTFQFAAAWASSDELRMLADYTIQRHFPHIALENEPYLSLLQETIKRQAKLIAKWQLVGFIHGVMNTDNMTISGETIDYGPCAFMDTYDPATVFSSIDREGRYAYGNQPYIGGWNLARFAEALLPLLHENQDEAVAIAQHEISAYSSLFHNYWLEGMRAKLGLFNAEEADEELIDDLLTMMQEQRADFTNTFRFLTLEKPEESKLFRKESFTKWHQRWQERLEHQKESKASAIQLMKRSNPAVIPRNHRVEEALNAAEKEADFTVMNKLLKVLEKPYEYTFEHEEYCLEPEPSNIPYQTFCGT
ncbi:UPF0061 protein [Robertmurraya siralis]|uniref:Protein nucleotidyltransferase YdiU n=1 Tax=Robertmurraya siralis TaxID=77777 RepID=A0A919WK73_9BACI|nr:YdiU family protein [Robertmurraya siralis]PAE21210.1 hypothetical protein CHH80_07005 [Bacillus sp. 7504-2]GIN63570.1 UPF0061 protein [Robertmurraya siralis]